MPRRSYGRAIASRCRPAVLAVVAAAVAVTACGDPSPGDLRADQVEGAAREAGLGSEVAQVLRRAALAVDATYRVAYDVEAGDGAVTRIEITQRPPHRRVDIIGADGTNDRYLTDSTSTVQCQRPAPLPGEAVPEGESRWFCQRLGRPGVADAIDPTAIDALTDALVEASDVYTFVVETRTVLGEEASCLVTTSAEADAELCIAGDGAVLVVTTPASSLQAVEHSTAVDPAAFDVPGEVAAGTGQPRLPFRPSWTTRTSGSGSGW